MNRPLADPDVLSKRAARFAPTSAPSPNTHRSKKERTRQDERRLSNAEGTSEFDQQLVGTCEMLEKCYLRLTAAPKESEVRPRRVLVMSLEKIKDIWEEEHNYQRALNLLKSVRQDITVQGIRDQLSIDVYETNAKISLQSKDPSEFNVCLSMLESLYEEVSAKSCLREEFMACRILYYLYTKDLCDLTCVLEKVVSERKVSVRQPDDCVNHAVNVALAWFTGSYHTLFRLYQTAPSLSSLVMDLFIDRERRDYYTIIMTAYRQNVPTDFVMRELFLDKSEATSFLSKVDAVFTNSTHAMLDCKASLANVS